VRPRDGGPSRPAARYGTRYLRQVRWLQEASESSIREVVVAAAPALAEANIELASTITTSNPEWCAGTATIARSFVVKFAWSKPAAIRVLREARILDALADIAPQLPIPRLVGVSSDPVGFVTRLVAGAPLGSDERPSWAAVGAEIAGFLASLHNDSVLAQVRAKVPELVEPKPQATTNAIRSRLPRFLDSRRAQLALQSCDWVDNVLATPSRRQVLAHGDLHGYNQVWDQSTWKLRLVADFEVSGPADPEYDLRYFPPLEPTLGLVRQICEQYSTLTGFSMDMRRAMAWHIRTALGDALWRSEADVPLPAACTPASYVDDIDRKLEELART
jgi:aminoglycoside phosphotransferase (APT) family kinase protein